MQALSNARRLSRVFKPPIFLLPDRFLSPDILTAEDLLPDRFLSPDILTAEDPRTSHQCRHYSSFVSQSSISSGDGNLSFLPNLKRSLPFVSGIFLNSYSRVVTTEIYSRIVARTNFCSNSITEEDRLTESVKKLYDEIHHSLHVKRSMPPNALLWSMIESCRNHEDIKSLFDSLQMLRQFRLSNLRISVNFNEDLCRKVTKACARVGAIDFGKKALWKHNVYGLTPTVGSVHTLLSYAKDHNDVKLMEDVMKLLKKNDIELQPGTADIVFSVCYNTENWELLSKYGKRFVKAGVKLRQTSFELWLDFAAKIGDIESLWKIEKLRSNSMKRHTLVTGFACAKGLLVECKPEDAAAVIQVLNQNLPDAEKSGINVELQKLVSEWPLKVIKHQTEEKQKDLAASLKSDIPTMINALLNMGLVVSVNMEDLTSKEEILS